MASGLAVWMHCLGATMIKYDMPYNRTIMFAIIVACIDIVCICVFILDLAWAGSDSYVAFGRVFGAFMLLPFFIVNITYITSAIFVSPKPKQIGIIGLLFLFSSVLCYRLNVLSSDRHEHWFVRDGVQSYSKCIDAIKENKEHLHLHSGYNERVDNLLQLPSIVRGDVLASTNADGSLLVVFVNRDGFCDTGYVFYDGTNSIVGNDGRWTINKNWGPYRPIYRSWYEY